MPSSPVALVPMDINRSTASPPKDIPAIDIKFAKETAADAPRAPVSKTAHINFELLSQYFHMPMKDVAQELGVCTTMLKRLCRNNGIPRWPFRQIKSINRMIKTMETSKEVRSQDTQRILGALHHKRHLLLTQPQLSNNTSAPDPLRVKKITQYTFVPPSDSDANMEVHSLVHKVPTTSEEQGPPVEKTSFKPVASVPFSFVPSQGPRFSFTAPTFSQQSVACGGSPNPSSSSLLQTRTQPLQQLQQLQQPQRQPQPQPQSQQHQHLQPQHQHHSQQLPLQPLGYRQPAQTHQLPMQGRQLAQVGFRPTRPFEEEVHYLQMLIQQCEQLYMLGHSHVDALTVVPPRRQHDLLMVQQLHGQAKSVETAVVDRINHQPQNPFSPFELTGLHAQIDQLQKQYASLEDTVSLGRPSLSPRDAADADMLLRQQQHISQQQQQQIQQQQQQIQHQQELLRQQQREQNQRQIEDELNHRAGLQTIHDQMSHQVSHQKELFQQQISGVADRSSSVVSPQAADARRRRRGGLLPSVASTTTSTTRRFNRPHAATRSVSMSYPRSLDVTVPARRAHTQPFMFPEKTAVDTSLLSQDYVGRSSGFAKSHHVDYGHSVGMPKGMGMGAGPQRPGSPGVQGVVYDRFKLPELKFAASESHVKLSVMEPFTDSQ